MKKVILGILGIFFGLSAFCSADSIGPVVYNASGNRLYISYGYNYFKTYSPSSSWYCGEGQFFGIGNYSDYYNGIFDFTGLTDNNLVYGDSSIYLLGYNNGYFLSGSSVVLSQDFYGSIYKNSLQCNSRANPTFFNNSYFNIGFDSSNNLHTITYYPNFGYTRSNSYSSINSPLVLLYSSDSLSLNSSVSAGFNNFIYIDSIRNQYFYFDNTKLYSKYGSKSDIPEGYIRKKFLINGDFNYSSIYLNSGNIGLLSVNNSGIVVNGGDFPSLELNPNYGYFLFHIVDYSSGFYAGSNSTFLLTMSGNSVIYNAYNVFSNSVEELNSLSPVRKGYLNGNFTSFVNSTGQYFEIYGSYINGITFRVYDFNTNSKYTNYSFSFVEDDSVLEINPEGESISNISENLQLLYCQQNPTSPYCNGIYTGSRDEVRCGVDNSGALNCYFTDYARPTTSEDCPFINSGLDNGQVFVQYRSTGENRCIQGVSASISDSSPEFGLDDFSDNGQYTQLISNAFVGILSGFNIHQCPFRSPFGILRLGTIGGMGSFLLDKFFDVNIIGPFSCLLGGVLYSTSDSQSISNQLVHYDGEKFLNSWSDQSKQYLNYLLMALIVILFRRFRPNSNSDH